MLKSKFLILFIFLYFNISAQNCDLEIYASNSQKFYLFLNGIKQKDLPQANFEVFNLPVGFYEAMITFPESADTLKKVLGLTAFTKTTYAIKHKKRKNKYKIRFKAQEGFRQTTSNLSISENTPFANFKSQKPNKNCNEIFNNFNELMRVRNYIRELQYDEEKVNAINRELQDACYLSFTLINLLSEIEDDYYKFELAKSFTLITYDLENLKSFSLSFKTNEFRNSYLNYIKQFE